MSQAGQLSDAQIKIGRRHLVTPEGVDLQIELADVGARIGAFTIDLVIMSLMLFGAIFALGSICLLYTSPSPRDRQKSRMPSSA